MVSRICTLLFLAFCVPLYSAAQHLPLYIPQPQSQSTSKGLDPTKDLSHYIHRQWRTEQGLPQNSAQALCQTRDGYLWIGTEEGLVRFDGVRFMVFDAEHTPGLRANTIQAIMEDRTGTLWIGTAGGGVSRYKNGVFTALTTDDGLASNFVSSIVEDRSIPSTDTNVAVWIGTLGGGVSRFHNGKFTTVSTREGLTHNLVFSLVQDRTGALWIGTNGGGLNRLANGTVTAFTTNNGLVHNLVRALLESSDGALWIGTFGGGVQRYANGVLTTFSAEQGLSNNLIWSLCQDRLGTVWVGTFGGGVHRFLNGKFQVFSTKNGLSSDLVRSIYSDRDGALWVGTVGGLNRFTDGKFTTFTTENGLPHNVVRAITERQADGNLWIGTFGGGVSLLPALMKTAPKEALTTKSGLSNEIVYTLLEDHSKGANDGALWVGTNGGGLNRWLHGKMTTFTTRDGLRNDVVFALMQDRNGTLWIGTGSGVNMYSNGVFTPVRTSQGVVSDNVRVILEDRSGAVWMGTVGNGLHRYKDGALTTFRTQNGLSNDNVRSLYEDADGTLWVGTNGGGLNRLKNGVFTQFTMKQGLFNDVIHCILEDEAGYLWMSCNKGIFRVRKRDLDSAATGELRKISCDAFGEADGMLNAECNSGNPAGFKDRTGKLWFSTMTGVVTIDPKNPHLNIVPPPATVIIEDMNADTLRVNLSAPTAFAPSVQKFEFHYTATNLSSPERIRFRYMLEGYDAQWVDAGKRRSAYYTNLPHGRSYRFRVIAGIENGNGNSSSNGQWNEAGASVEFSVSSYFWETWWFLLLSGVVLSALAVMGYRVRTRRLYRKAKKLEETVALRTTELRESNQEIQRQLEQLDEQAREIELSNTELRAINLQLEVLHKEKDEFLGIAAHDLKNPLTSIAFSASFIRRLSRDTAVQEPIEEQVGRIELLTGRMTAIISNFLDMNALEAGALKFQIEPLEIMPLVHSIVEEYHPKAAAKNVTLNTDFSAEQMMMYADRQMVEGVFDNLISNAVKYSPHGKSVFMRLYAISPQAPSNQATKQPSNQATKILRFEVQDEGQGISEEDMTRLFGKFARLSAQPTGGEHSTGLGLSIVKKIVEAMHGRVWCESEFGKGATFIVELPIAQR